MNQDSNWPAWISAVGAGVVLVVAFLKSFFVTHAQLRIAVDDAEERSDRRHAESVKLTDARHGENLERFQIQDEELKVIRAMVSRIEGQLSGRYPRVGP